MGASPSVLHVDDSPDDRRFLKRGFLSIDPTINVEGTDNQESFLSHIERRTFAIWVIDYRLQGSNGVELMRTALVRRLIPERQYACLLSGGLEELRPGDPEDARRLFVNLFNKRSGHPQDWRAVAQEIYDSYRVFSAMT